MVSELSTLIHNLVLDNPVPAKDLAKAIGKPYSTLLREVNPYDTGAKLGAETLLQIMLQISQDSYFLLCMLLLLCLLLLITL